MTTRTPSQLAAQLAGLDRPEDEAARQELIIGALGDRSTPVRDLAVAWAARCLEPARLVPLVADEADSILRNAALAALERQGPYAVSQVESLTTTADADLAMFACQVLGSIAHGSNPEPLLAALARPEVNVVQAAIEALGRLRMREAVPTLAALLTRDPWLGLAAADSLGSIGDAGAVPALVSIPPDSLIASPALDALRRIGSPSVLRALLPRLTDPAWLPHRAALVEAVSGALAAGEPSDELTALGAAMERDHSVGGLWHLLSDWLADGVGDSLEGPPERDDRAQRRGGSPTVQAAGAMVLAAQVSSLLPLVVRWGATREGLSWLGPLAERYPSGIEAALDRLLAHPDHEVRAGALRLAPPRTVGRERLVGALRDGASEVRLAAINALAVLADPAAIEALLGSLGGEVAAESSAAARALARMPAAPLDAALHPWLEVGEPEARLAAALTVMADVYLEGLAPRVVELAGGTAGTVRRLALRAAAKIPGSRAEVVLIRALADRDPSVQVEALELLVGRGNERVVTTFIALLSVADSLRYHVIRALGRLGDRRAAPALEALFSTAAFHEQLEICGTLGRLRAANCRAFLVDALASTQDEVRHAAAQALMDVAEPEDIEVIRKLAADQDWVLRSEAARGFGRLGLAEARPVLLDLARDIEPAVARTARAALAGHP